MNDKKAIESTLVKLLKIANRENQKLQAENDRLEGLLRKCEPWINETAGSVTGDWHTEVVALATDIEQALGKADDESRSQKF